MYKATQQLSGPLDVSAEAQTASYYLIPAPPSTKASIALGDFLTIGRDSSNLLQIHDPFASKRHARIDFQDNHYLLRDLQSSNGTFVNGAKICECYLSAQDRISFGTTEFIFSANERLHDQNLVLESKNATWNLQLQQIPVFAKTDFPVLILGPSGSGKEVLAGSIHGLSDRCEGPFISVNCSALSESLVESELFGHVRGSFTGATHDRKGAFEAARGGTLFLDEIGDLPLSLQPKLLRALENSEIRPVGSDRVIKTNVRILAATHQRLQHRVHSGDFRADLYFRLNVIKIQAPPLHERMEDFDDLIYEFARQMRVRLSFQAIERLKQYTWPGNIRELKNVVSRAAASFQTTQIQPEQLDLLLDDVPLRSTGEPIEPIPANGPVIKEIEREMIRKRLIANKGNQRRTAAELGIAKSTLHDRIRSYRIDLESLEDEY